MLIGILAVEAFARGYFVAFFWRMALLVLVVNTFELYLDNWQVATAALLGVLAVIVLVVNVRDIRKG